MSKALRIIVLPVLALLCGQTAALAQIITDDDCSQTCTSNSYCTAPCAEDGSEGSVWTTCGYYGLCDVDPDDDGLVNDNCPYVYNPGQADCDGDGTGDVCDGENGSFRTVGGPELCQIVGRVHLFYVDVRPQFEWHYRDRSSCGSPDKWVQFDGDEEICPPMSAYSCCVFNYGGSDCDEYLNDNHCHY